MGDDARRSGPTGGVRGTHLGFDAVAHERVMAGVDAIADRAKVTLGPGGRNVVVDEMWGAHTITKDGVTVAKEIDVKNRFERMGAQMVREVATRTSDIVRDGTTTATVLAQSIYGAALKLVAAGHDPTEIKRGIDIAVVKALETLKELSTPIRGSQDIAYVGTISAKGDAAIGELIAEALRMVGKDGVITVEEARTLTSELEVVPGVRFERGYLSAYFMTDTERGECVLDDAYVLLHEKKISGMKGLLPVLEQVAKLGKPLLIIAEDVDGEALATLTVNKLRGTLHICAIKAPGNEDSRQAILRDIAALTGGRVSSEEPGLSLENTVVADLGRARRITVNHKTTTIVNGAGKTEDVDARANAIRSEIARAESDSDRDTLQERLAKLTGSVAILRVGAATDFEMNEKTARVENALHATRAALEDGVVPGGGVALLRAQAALDAIKLDEPQRSGVAIVRRALEEPLRQIAGNAGMDGAAVVGKVRAGDGAFGFNAVSLEYGDMMKAGVIDPTKVVRAALLYAGAVASEMLAADVIAVPAERAGPAMTTDAADEDLMEQYQRGELRAFEVLLSRHRKPVYNFILRSVGDQETAEDLLQEAVMRVMKGAEAYRRDSRFTTWLYAIARGLCATEIKRRERRQHASLDAVIASGELESDRKSPNKQPRATVHRAIAAPFEEQGEVGHGTDLGNGDILYPELEDRAEASSGVGRSGGAGGRVDGDGGGTAGVGRGDGDGNGGGGGSGGPPPGPSTVTRYPDVLCPERVSQNTRFPVTVALVTDRPAGGAIDSPMKVNPDLLVDVTLEAHGFDILGPAHHQISTKLGASPVVFDLQAKRLGDGRVILDFHQGSNPLGSFTIPVEVVGASVAYQQSEHRRRALDISAAEPPDYLLRISYDRVEPRSLRFSLRSRHDVLDARSFAPIALKDAPEEHARQLYQKLDLIRRRIDPVAKTERDLARGLTGVQLEDKLRRLGQSLWQNLIPADLKAHYEKSRAQLADRSLLIVSDEPALPWELLWPYGAGWQDAGPLCTTMRLSRWLRSDEQGNGGDGPPAVMRLSRMATLIPTDSALKYANTEAEFLRNFEAQHHVSSAGVVPPVKASVMSALEAGGYDWLHATAHGDATESGTAPLWLENSEALTPDEIVGPSVEDHIRARRPGFVLNACDLGQAGWCLTGMSGWANQLLKVGAGMFLAPLWQVSDSVAVTFVQTFYEELAKNERVADAMRTARLRTRDVRGDPSWMAYVLYAHPNARVVFGPAAEEAHG